MSGTVKYAIGSLAGASVSIILTRTSSSLPRVFSLF
jgi:hypothetical protein